MCIGMGHDFASLAFDLETQLKGQICQAAILDRMKLKSP